MLEPPPKMVFVSIDAVARYAKLCSEHSGLWDRITSNGIHGN
jgi:hypothetical protein